MGNAEAEVQDSAEEEHVHGEGCDHADEAPAEEAPDEEAGDGDSADDDSGSDADAE